MALGDAVESVTKSLREGRYPNEPAIAQGVVLRLLSELGWDIYNPDFVWPEYSVGQRRVDYALCSPPKRPVVFLEAKQPGKTEGADQQLFEYAFHQGVPMAVLCDGKTWSFYLPAQQGSCDERRVYKLDLLERSVNEAAEKLTRYLDFQRIACGQAIDDATNDYRDQSRRVLAKRTIPEAWKELVDGEDPTLFERLTVQVENKCGVKPELDDIGEFLATLRPVSGGPAAPAPPSPPKPPPPGPGKALPPTGRCGYELHGRSVPCRNAQEVMVSLLGELAASAPSFPERCYRHRENKGRVRTYVAQAKEELYPGRPDMEKHSAEFTPGWFVATNVSNQLKDHIIRLAADVAGLTRDADLRYWL